MAILDLFAGHGVGVACKQLGVTEYAVEKWGDAVATREANGLPLAYSDVWDIDKAEGLDFEGLWASPPCQTFSTAGKGEGRRSLDTVLALLRDGTYEDFAELRKINPDDDRTGLVLSPLGYVWRYSPRFVVFEQVTPVLPVWDASAERMKQWGYSTWTGVIDAADYGVPQNRKRAYLIARKDGLPKLPEKVATPTLASIRSDQEGIISNYSSGSGGILIPGNKKARGYRRVDQPAFTVTGKVRSNRWFPSLETVTCSEALQMQSYPADFKVLGDWSLQVGNAVPPLLARKILETLI